MASQYRRKRGSDTWHFCSNGTRYPASDHDTSPSKPTRGELCDGCLGNGEKRTANSL